MANGPICFHSLFRTASTYFFSKLRGIGPGFSCYQEPFNDALVALNRTEHHERLLLAQQGSLLRHPQLERPHFHEYWLSRERLRGLFHERFAYQEYFPDASGELPGPQIAYLSALLECAQGRPVLKFCRSSGRIAALRRTFGGTHVYLWREPRVQWWSYKVAPYFDDVTRRIYQATALPEALRQVRALAGMGARPVRHLAPRDSYLIFYGLWLDAWLRVPLHVDLSINVDAIAVSAEENRDCSRRLSELVGSRLDLSDLRPSGMVFSPEEESFYEELERAVSAIFVQSRRASAARVGAAIEAARCAREAHRRLAHDATAERNVRQAAVAMMEELAAPERARQHWSLRSLAARLTEGWHASGQATQAPPAEVPESAPLPSSD